MDILKDNVNRTYFRFLLPTIGATLITSVYILADAIIIGRFINDKAMAALNVLTPIFSLFYGSGYLLGVGGAVLMAAAFGENKIKKGQKYFTSALFLSALLSLIYVILFNLGFEFLIKAIGATADITSYIRSYGRILVSGAPLFLFSAMLQVFVRNDLSPKTAMTGVIAGGITNVVFDYIFIVPLNMGIAGGAWATLCGCVLSLIIYSAHFFKKDNRLKPVKNSLNIKNILMIFKCGFPNFFIEVSNAVVISLFNIQLGRLIGFEGITAYGIVENAYLVVNSLSNGVAQAVQPLAAANYSSKNHKRVKLFFRNGLITAFLISVLSTLLGELYPQKVISLFVNANKSLLNIAVPAVRIYFISFLMAVTNIYLSGFFQSLMKSRYSMIICVLRGLLLSSVFIFILPLAFGTQAIWFVTPLAEFATLIYGLYCLKFKIKL